MTTLRGDVESLVATQSTQPQRDAVRAYLLGRQVHGARGDLERAATWRLRAWAQRSGGAADLASSLAAALRDAGGVASPTRLEAVEPRLEGLSDHPGLVALLLEAGACRDVCRVRADGRDTLLLVDAVLRGVPATDDLWFAWPFADQVAAWLRGLRRDHLLFVLARYARHPLARRLVARTGHRDLHNEVYFDSGLRLQAVVPFLAAALRRYGAPVFVPTLEVVEPWFEGVTTQGWVLDFLADAPWSFRSVAPVDRQGLRYLDLVPGAFRLNDVIVS
jgi:hypothetical protein